MTSHIKLPNSHPMDFSLQSDAADQHFTADSAAANGAKKIPKELTSHGTTPSGKPRLFVCNTCTRAFARLEHLRRHERSHTKEKPFPCGICKRKFSRRDLLLRHAQKLHKGATEAITRLRRKSSKESGLAPTSEFYEEDENYMKDMNSATPGAQLDPSFSGSASQRGSVDPVQFNLDLFPGRAKDRTPSSPMRMSRSNSVKDGRLQRQLFDKRRERGRHASFSAQSGSNYAMAMPGYTDSNTADNVEFSTPQLLPSTTNDEDSWLSNLCTIPGMTPSKNDASFKSEMDLDLPKHTAIFGSALTSGLIRSNSITSNNSNNTMDSSNLPFLGGKQSFSAHPPSISAGATPNPEMKLELQDYGYSFYDIPESMMVKSTPAAQTYHPLSPIKQEMDDELMEMDHGSQNYINNSGNQYATVPGDVDIDLNFLNDIDNLVQDFDVGTKFLPAGYSFYGDNPSVSSSGIESTSPMLSPSAMQTVGPNHTTSFHPGQTLAENPVYANLMHNRRAFEARGYSKTNLFTKNMRHLISRALNKYPISDVMSPSIPSNEKMEYFLKTFVERFLSYSPFIHPSKLNEYEIMNMTLDEDAGNESARVCMPLIVATMGALLANNKNDSEHLYEASRRTIHIYLESRKKSAKVGASPTNTINPLWLIQSLTLSVVYGLFSDNENNVYIVIRQLNALNSLVKTSLRANKEVLFSITGEDEMIYNCLQSPQGKMGINEMVDREEMRYKNCLNMQSQTRIVLAIYQLTNFILMMYNVPLTLSANDLGSLTCPNIYDEYLWGLSDYNEFAYHLQAKGSDKNMDYFLAKNENNTIVFKDILQRIARHEFDTSMSTKLAHLSKFGFNTIVKGLYEFMQYEELGISQVESALNNLTFHMNSSASNPDVQFLGQSRCGHEKIDYALLANFVKVCSIVDLKFVKEQSWLRNYEELNRNYHILLTSMDTIDEQNYLKIIDYCLNITRLVLLRTDEVSHNILGTDEFLHLDHLRNPEKDNVLAMVIESIKEEKAACAEMEKLYGLKVYDEIFTDKTPIHSQVLFHVYVIFSIFAVYVAKRNNPATEVARSHGSTGLRQVNRKFISVLRLLAKFEKFLKLRFENAKSEADISGLYLFSSGATESLLIEEPGFNGHRDKQMENHFAFSLDKSLYMLKIGEMMMRFLYENNIKISIFKKLSGSISHIRKYLIDEEGKILS